MTVVDFDEFTEALGALGRTSAELTLIRPSIDDPNWKVRYGDQVFSVKAPAEKQGLARGLMALWVLINAPGAKMPYLLLEVASRRKVDTRPNEGSAGEKAAKAGLRSKLEKIFQLVWQREASPEEALSAVREALAAQSRETQAEARSQGFGLISASLAAGPLEGPAAKAARTPAFAQEAKRAVRGNLRQATAAIREAVEGHLPGLPAYPNGRMGQLMDDFLIDKSPHWVVFSPPPSLLWHAK